MSWNQAGLTYPAPTEITEESSLLESSEEWQRHRQVPRVSAGRGEVPAEEGHTPEHKKQSTSSDVVKSTNSPVLDSAETNIKSIQGIRVQISKIHCYIQP